MAKTRVRHDGASTGIRPRDPVIRRGATRRTERSRGLSGCSGVGAAPLLLCSLVFARLRLSPSFLAPHRGTVDAEAPAALLPALHPSIHQPLPLDHSVPA